MPFEVASILSTTTDPVSDSYGNIFPVEISGSGRINLTRAFSADMIIEPRSLVFSISLEKPFQTKSLYLKKIQGALPPLEIEFSIEESGIKFEHSLESDLLNVTISLTEEKLGDFEGMLTLHDSKTRYHIPILIHITRGAINTTENNGMLSFSLDYPEAWSYTKISVTNIETGQTRVTSITPEKRSSFVAYDAGENWVEAQITTQNGIDIAYGTITVQHPSEKTGLEFLELLGIPLKHILIISGILVAAVIVGLKFRHS